MFVGSVFLECLWGRFSWNVCGVSKDPTTILVPEGGGPKSVGFPKSPRTPQLLRVPEGGSKKCWVSKDPTKKQSTSEDPTNFWGSTGGGQKFVGSPVLLGKSVGFPRTPQIFGGPQGGSEICGVHGVVFVVGSSFGFLLRGRSSGFVCGVDVPELFAGSIFLNCLWGRVS